MINWSDDAMALIRKNIPKTVDVTAQPVQKVIPFYIPNAHKPGKWTPPSQCGKLLEFKLKTRDQWHP